MNEKLKPCLCGGEAEIMEQEYNDELGYTYPAFYVECNRCGEQGTIFDTPEEAIESWNRRGRHEKTGILDA